MDDTIADKDIRKGKVIKKNIKTLQVLSLLIKKTNVTEKYVQNKMNISEQQAWDHIIKLKEDQAIVVSKNENDENEITILPRAYSLLEDLEEEQNIQELDTNNKKWGILSNKIVVWIFIFAQLPFTINGLYQLFHKFFNYPR